MLPPLSSFWRRPFSKTSVNTWVGFFLEYSQYLGLFSYSRLFEIRTQRLLLDIFIQIGSRVVDTVPAGTGIIKVILQG